MVKNPFSQKIVAEGEKLVQQGKIQDLTFSRGAYQAEVALSSLKKVYPFLHISDRADVIDAFCDCKDDAVPSMCEHIAGSYLRILQQQAEPLHVRFRLHFFNKLAQMAARRSGFDVGCIRSQKDIRVVSDTGKELFSLKAKTSLAIKKIDELLFCRPEESEDNSLKFFNLPSEELALWKEGKASWQLQYELSFWSDLAKWWLFSSENPEGYSVTFSSPKQGLPSWVEIDLADVKVGFYIARASWPFLIPSLATVRSHLSAKTDGDGIERIIYDKKERLFILEGELALGEGGRDSSEGVELEGWVFYPKEGVFIRKTESFFSKEKIYADRIGDALHRYRSLFARTLSPYPLHEGKYPLHYRLEFDAEKNLHIFSYLFTPGDLLCEDSAFFGLFVFVDTKGFYEIEPSLFPAKQTKIPRNKVADFISKHKAWLSAIDGFQTHLMTIDSELTYHVDRDDALCFSSHFALLGQQSDAIDFGEWVYIGQKGFFQKEKEKGSSSLYAGLQVEKNQVCHFIRKHTHELEHLSGFFSHSCPIEAIELDLLLDAEERICIRPHYVYKVKVDPSRVFVFGQYCFVDKEGFSLMPFKMGMEPYLQEKVLNKEQRNYFLLSDLDKLRPFVRLCDPRLKKPSSLSLCLTRIQNDKKNAERPWLVDIEYRSEIGKVEAFYLWGAITHHEKFIFSSAGLVDLSPTRFHWLKTLNKGRWLKNGRQLRLSALELARLSAFEQIIEPEGADECGRDLLDEFRQMSTESSLSTEGFTSVLRPYQQTGLKWLWFLYLHGLSGLLCDEMGLGKTHQAMGLIAAIFNAKEAGGKFLIVCPTSVIYHWEDLLSTFLPHLKVYVFYGLARELAAFSSDCHILLTSYGTLRSERKELGSLFFDLAVFDEVQNAKNIKSQTHKSIKMMKYTMALGLTGTPLENRLLDMRALFEIILPGYLPAETQFKDLFVIPIEKWSDGEKKALFAKVVRPFILRRKKSEVLLELPGKIEELYYCDLSEEQKKMYQQTFYSQKDLLLKELSDPSSSKGYIHIFSVLSRLKQICNHPVMINKDFAHYSKYTSGKWELFVEKLQETLESGQKVVVFTQYLDMMDLFERYLTEKKIGFAQIRGSTRNRREQIEMFKNEPLCRVFIASLQAAGAGIELTAASVVIHYDRWWNPAKENQATDRVHRLGQSRGVHVFKLVTKKSVEERIDELIRKKSALFESVIGYDDQDHIKTLSRNELIALVEDLEKDL